MVGREASSTGHGRPSQPLSEQGIENGQSSAGSGDKEAGRSVLSGLQASIDQTEKVLTPACAGGARLAANSPTTG